MYWVFLLGRAPQQFFLTGNGPADNRNGIFSAAITFFLRDYSFEFLPADFKYQSATVHKVCGSLRNTDLIEKMSWIYFEHDLLHLHTFHKKQIRMTSVVRRELPDQNATDSRWLLPRGIHVQGACCWPPNNQCKLNADSRSGILLQVFTALLQICF